ncbi:retinol dehydrogenase 12 [Copidosoma floridanum]|uniref:retinol dehydrogenase 12 n=1 Tax=Copidosoma floridanum TaxID=29053 RepID=UPI0006C98D53|nr:retinol dehydrogenase 12 [Copidosoma floridanum]XP_014216439.1 retinol dehydrogenase 12 [Copidosoma floridanum]
MKREHRLPLAKEESTSAARYLPRCAYKSSSASSGLGMLFLILGSVATLLGYGLVRRRNNGRIAFALDWLRLQVEYNAVAVKEIFYDRLQARYNRTELPLIPGRIAIVTGGSRGIGAEIVRMLLQCDLEVIIACRRPAAGDKVVEDIRKSGVLTGKTKVMKLDNSSLGSVRAFVEAFKNNYKKLDILINNAGVMFPPYGETEDGFEEQYGVNYLSHFLLTVLLIPLLKNAGDSGHPAKIVNVSSCAHLLGDINFDDINRRKGYFLTGVAYAQSKLAQVLFTKSLARLFEEKKLPIRANAVHPGIVATDLFDNSYLKYLKPVGRLLFKTPRQGATPIVYAAVSPAVEHKSGLYISNCLESTINPLAADKAVQDRLFELSLKQVGLQNAFDTT